MRLITQSIFLLTAGASLVVALATGCSKKDGTTPAPGDTVVDEGGGGDGGTSENGSSVSPTAENLIASLVKAIGPSAALLADDTAQLTAGEAAKVGEAARAAVVTNGNKDSSDLTLLLADIMGGAEGSLDSFGAIEPAKVVSLSGKMASSLFLSLSTADAANLPEASAADGQTAKGTAVAGVGEAAMASLTSAGIADADIPTVSQDLAGAIVGSIGKVGSGEDDIVDADLPALTAGFTVGISAMPGSAVSSADRVSAISTGSAKGLADLVAKLPTAGNASRALTAMTASMTQNLNKFSTDPTALPDLAAKLSAGATAGLGRVVTAFSLSTNDQSDLVAATTAGPTQGLSTLTAKVPALASSSNLSNMLDKITSGPAAGLSKAGFSAAQVPGLLSSMAYGASANLGMLTQISGLSSADASSFLSKISQSANTAAGSVDVANFTANTASMTLISEKVAQKSTSAINRIASVDPNFSSNNAQDAIKSITSGAVAALGTLAKNGRISQSDIGTLAGKASKGALGALSDLNVPGMSGVSATTIASQIGTAQNSAMDGLASLQIQGFNAETAKSTANTATTQATSGVTIPQFDLSTAKTQCTNMRGTWDSATNRCSPPPLSGGTMPSAPPR